jgi:hypothetical protein
MMPLDPTAQGPAAKPAGGCFLVHPNEISAAPLHKTLAGSRAPVFAVGKHEQGAEGMMFFQIGDFLVGMLVGVLTALAVRAVMWPGIDMVIAMLVGMGLGMIIHFVVAFAVGPLLGMFQTMMPASVIGMYGGMFFGMRDSMDAGSATWGAAALVGAIFGAVVVAALKVYDRALHGPVLDAEG